MIVLGRKKQSEKCILESVKPGLLLFRCLGLPDSFVTPWTTDHQCLLSMEFPRQESWSALPFPPQEDFPNPVIIPMSPALQPDS